MKKGVTFYFMRHGETYFNALGRMQGWSNALLTADGKDEIRRSGRGFADVKFDAVYTSDLMRTIDTARIFLSENNHLDSMDNLYPMSEFREVHFGSFEGLEIEDAWGSIAKAVELEHGLPRGSDRQIEHFMNMTKAKDPRGWAENYVEFWNRVESGLLQLLNKHAGTDQNILVVSHGLTIRNLIHGLVADFEHTESLDNASLSIVRYIDGQFRLLAYNQTDHFKDLAEEIEE